MRRPYFIFASRFQRVAKVHLTVAIFERLTPPSFTSTSEHIVPSLRAKLVTQLFMLFNKASDGSPNAKIDRLRRQRGLSARYAKNRDLTDNRNVMSPDVTMTSHDDVTRSNHRSVKSLPITEAV